MRHFKTVLGDISENELGVTLAHEHICCYSEYVYTILGSRYLEKDRLVEAAAKYLLQMKQRYGLKTFIDCTPINIGRDIELLRAVSQKSGINIICATGFYHTDETLLYNTPTSNITDYIVSDAKKANAGIIKCAVENEKIGSFHEKMLRACARAQLSLGLPIVLHTNAKNQNGQKALELLLSEGVKPQAITVGHLSDTRDMEYVRKIAEYGCFIGLDRLYNDIDEEYISEKLGSICALCDDGYADKILLSHDALFFNGFDARPTINEKPRFSHCFDYILPKLPKQLAEKIMIENPLRMLRCDD